MGQICKNDQIPQTQKRKGKTERKEKKQVSLQKKTDSFAKTRTCGISDETAHVNPTFT